MPKSNPNPITKQHTVVSIQLNIVKCPTYPEKFVRGNVVAPFSQLFVITVTLQSTTETGINIVHRLDSASEALHIALYNSDYYYYYYYYYYYLWPATTKPWALNWLQQDSRLKTTCSETRPH